MIALALPAVVYSAVSLPPSIGLASNENRYVPSLELVYYNDFETESIEFEPGLGVAYTTEDAKVIDGTRSVSLDDPAVTKISGPDLNFIGGETYVVEFEYILGNPEPGGSGIFIGVFWDDFLLTGEAESGPLPGYSPARGVYQHNIRLPEEGTGFGIQLGVTGGTAVIDELRVYRLVNRVYPAFPNLLRFGFPRIGNFHVYSTSSSALLHSATTEEIRDVLGRYDLVNGIEIDHTLGGSFDYLPLKERNPDILLFPYHQTFQSVLTSGSLSPPAGGSAGLHRFFNIGLADGWFMLSPEGTRLYAPFYPDNYQMNMSSFCPVVEGFQFSDYTQFYLQNTIIPSGYWSGIHFDQATWYPNFLLSTDWQTLVPMDLDNDGEAETAEELYDEWMSAYTRYFDEMDQRVGQSSIFLGNEGEMPLNPEVVRRLNGFQFEYFSPYEVLEDNTYQIRNASFWHRYLDVSLKSRKLLRVPQVVSTQMTGRGLGTPTETLTGNGFPDREPVLVPEDYLRMRFGLATTLMTDGFFGYDFVDNSTLPTAWLDEFGIDLETGEPSLELDDRHYLGQPLGEPVELEVPAVEIFNIDFESGIPSYQSGVYFLEEVTLETDPALVIAGDASARISFVADPLDSDVSQAIFLTLDTELPLEEDKTYQLFIDYRVIEYDPVHFGTFLGMGTVDFDDPTTLNRYALGTLLYSDTIAGLEGTLRGSSKASNGNFLAFAALTDSGTIIVDNIQLVESTGGVFRRDFENGVVLVNPTPEAISVTTDQLQGPLDRTGLRRISGIQDPLLNDGSSVDAEVVIAAASGLVLLADAYPAPEPQSPLQLTAVAAESGLTLSWQQAAGTVAGYLLRYGLTGGDLTLYKPVGPVETTILESLLPGREYSFAVASFDYEGQLSEYSTPIEVTMAGALPESVPVFSPGDPLARGTVHTISGETLATTTAEFSAGAYPFEASGTSVLLNGVPAQLVSISPGAIQFVVPGNLGGDVVALRVELDGISSVAHYAGITPESAEPSPLQLRFLSDYTSVEVEWDSSPNAPLFSIEYSEDMRIWETYGTPDQPTIKARKEEILEFDSPTPKIFVRIRESSVEIDTSTPY